MLKEAHIHTGWPFHHFLLKNYELSSALGDKKHRVSDQLNNIQLTNPLPLTNRPICLPKLHYGKGHFHTSAFPRAATPNQHFLNLKPHRLELPILADFDSNSN